MAVTLVVAMALPFLLPPRFSLGPEWIIPVVEALLLIALVIANPQVDHGSGVQLPRPLYRTRRHS